ncbi:MAG: chap protein, partial [Actinomycetota bacterium]|nr:chap protein [Actinomycetota bacterium]
MAPASAAAHGPVKLVRYRAYSLRVPASWPVFRLASDPSACVRFDRHAVYLGRPSSRQRCPAHAVGRTEAILVEPLAAAAARSRAAAGAALPDAKSA